MLTSIIDKTYLFIGATILVWMRQIQKSSLNGTPVELGGFIGNHLAKF